MNSKRLLCFLLGAALLLQTPATAYAEETLTYEQYKGGSGYSSTTQEQDYAIKQRTWNSIPCDAIVECWNHVFKLRNGPGRKCSPWYGTQLPGTVFEQSALCGLCPECNISGSGNVPSAHGADGTASGMCDLTGGHLSGFLLHRHSGPDGYPGQRLEGTGQRDGTHFAISDLHLFHEAAIRFDDRPFRDLEEMHTEIVKRWNEKVNNGDTVYILGDVSMRGKNENLIALVAILKGKKVLIRGNHDDVSDLRYRQLFSEVCDYKEIRDSIAGKSYELVLCHYPIFSWKHMSRGTILLYGHTHNSPEDDYFQKCLVGMRDNGCRHIGDSTIQAYNVGCMKPWMDYEPRSLQEIIKMKFVENGN